MTTTDSKYKHKPSEKHTLEEVLKSLQDMIRNDLLDDDREESSAEQVQSPAASTIPADRGRRPGPVREDFAPTASGTGPVNLDAVMRSLKDLINNELDTGEHAVQEDTTFQPQSVETEPDLGQSEEFAPLDEELTFEDTENPEVDEEHAPMEKSLAPDEDQISEEPAAEAFEPLDEELSIDEPLDLSPAPVPDNALPEIPGEISPELLGDAESETARTRPEAERRNEITPGDQHEFMLDDLPPREIESDANALNDLQESEPAAETELEREADSAGSDEALPTIEVEETFDDNNYFQPDTSSESLPSELQEIQEIIVSALGAPEEGATPPQTDSPVSSDEQQRVQENDSVGEPESSPEDISPPDDNELTVEMIGEPETREHDMPSIDFESMPLEPPKEEQAPLPESAALETRIESPESSAKAPVATQKPSSQEAVAGKEPDAGGKKKPDSRSAPPGSRRTRRTRRTDAPKVKTDESPAADLDNIPTLKDVVSPTGGSILKPESPAISSKERLPRPNRAREIVVRAVAKLNVEMRKSGGTGIDTKTILRLQKLIQEQLENDEND